MRNLFISLMGIWVTLQSSFAQSNVDSFQVYAGPNTHFEFTVPPGTGRDAKLVIWYMSRGTGATAVQYYVSSPVSLTATFGAERYVPQRAVRENSVRKFSINSQDVRTASSIRHRTLAAEQNDASVDTERWIVSRDACAPAKTAYRIGVMIGLERVPENALAEGFSFQIQFVEGSWQGKRAASIKPVSDGRFYPQPLLLMSSIGVYSGNGDEIRLRRWSGSRVRAVSRVAVQDYVNYGPLFLTRSTVGSLLKGGKGSFDITDGRETYSVCFALERRRQSANGYPRE